MEDKVIKLAKTLGEELQKSEFYTSYEIARQESDKDEKLQGLIKEFNEIKDDINKIMMDKDAPKDKLDDMNGKLREVYDEVMNNSNMMAFNSAKDDLDQVMTKINSILTAALNGKDPNTAEVEEEIDGGCSSGGCSGCSRNA